MRKHFKHFVFSLMVLGLVFASASIIAAAPIPVSLVDGDWINDVPDVTINNSGPTGGLSTARWGTPAGGSGQSGYNFQSVAVPFNAASTGAPFALGQFTHLNYPITGTFLTGIDLLVNLNIGGVTPTATFHFNHDETPNSSTPETNPLNDDIVTLTNPILNANFSYLGNNYFFNLIGFSVDGGATISTVFKTVETQANVATLYGEITQTPISTPEPISLLLLGLGLFGVAGVSRKLKK